jgi:8-oxo-dGTP pyrophosphatase MutT (NUDIX family)
MNMQTLCYRPNQEPDPYLASLKQQAISEGRQCIVDAIIIDPSDRVLILKRAPNKTFLPACWDLPGGHVATQESLEAALRREVIEEIGTTLERVDALIAVWDWSFDPTEKVRQFEFIASLHEPSLELSIDITDFSEYRWISEPELPTFMENREPTDTQMLEVLRYAYSLRRDR